MNAILGIVLFAVGALGAFIAATATMAYFRALDFYAGLKKVWRVALDAGMILIAILTSVLIAQMLIPDDDTPTMESAAASAVEESGAEAEDSEANGIKAPKWREWKSLIKGAKTNETEKSDEAGKSGDAKAEQSSAADVKAETFSTNVEETTAEAAQNTEAAAEAEKTPEPEQTVAVEPQTKAVPLPNTALENPLAIGVRAWTNTYKGNEYAYVEVENGTPYVYAPNARGTFWYDLNNITSGRESGNIVVMANAGVFNDNSSPRGALVQNGTTILTGQDSKLESTLVIDEDGNVGYTNKAIINGTVEYTDVLTNKKVSGKKIVSAVTAFSPIVINGKAATAYKNRVANYAAYRPRSIFCVRAKGSYTLIANKGEGEAGGGWNFDDMTTVALRRGCQFAFNMDGGGSTALAWRKSLSAGFSTYVVTERYDPTFIVFTADNLAPSGK